MTATTPQNVSVNSWKQLPKDERKKMIIKLQEENNVLKLTIDKTLKTLVDQRATVPEECRLMFEEEKRILLNHYTNAELLPTVSKEGLGPGESQRLVNNIKERVEARVADNQQTRQINEQTKKIDEENEVLRQKIISMAGDLIQLLGA